MGEGGESWKVLLLPYIKPGKTAIIAHCGVFGNVKNQMLDLENLHVVFVCVFCVSMCVFGRGWFLARASLCVCVCDLWTACRAFLTCGLLFKHTTVRFTETCGRFYCSAVSPVTRSPVTRSKLQVALI